MNGGKGIDSTRGDDGVSLNYQAGDARIYHELSANPFDADPAVGVRRQ